MWVVTRSWWQRTTTTELWSSLSSFLVQSAAHSDLVFTLTLTVQFLARLKVEAVVRWIASQLAFSPSLSLKWPTYSAECTWLLLRVQLLWVLQWLTWLEFDLLCVGRHCKTNTAHTTATQFETLNEGDAEWEQTRLFSEPQVSQRVAVMSSGEWEREKPVKMSEMKQKSALECLPCFNQKNLLFHLILIDWWWCAQPTKLFPVNSFLLLFLAAQLLFVVAFSVFWQGSYCTTSSGH